MYRVIVVDDEPWSLIGIRKFLEYGKNRFEIIYETTDPVEALKRIEEDRPEVVFTDVRMPDISGIELVHKVREMGLETVFVVFSGYAEFSYVQQALREGVIDYQLKPLEMYKAEEMLDRLYRKLEEKRNTSDLNLYLSLREKRNNAVELLQARFPHSFYEKWQAVTVYFKDTDCEMSAFAVGDGVQYTRLKIGPRKCIFLLNSIEDKSGLISAALHDRKQMIDKAGISRPGGAESFMTLMRTSDLAAEDCFINPKERISIYREPKRQLADNLAQSLKEALDKCHFSKFRELIHGLTDYFAAGDMGIEDAAFLWNKLVTPFSEYAEKAGIEDDLQFLDSHALGERFEDLKTMGEYWYELLLPSDTDSAGTANEKFQEMLSYIDHHYAEELFLNELCDQFFINISYCCKLFRRTTNMTFSRYITHLRLEKACALLKSNDSMSIAEVCEHVGYNDYFYFARVFKKSIGCTPSEYKRQEPGGPNAQNQ